MAEVLHTLFSIGCFLLVTAFFHKRGLPWLATRLAGGKQKVTAGLDALGLALADGRTDDLAVAGIDGLGGGVRLVSTADSCHLEVKFRRMKWGERQVWLDMRPRYIWGTDWWGWNRYPLYSEGAIHCTGQLALPEFEIQMRKPQTPFTIGSALRRVFVRPMGFGFAPTLRALPGLPVSSFADPALDADYVLYTADASLGPSIAPIIRAWRAAAFEEHRALTEKYDIFRQLKHWKLALQMHGSGPRFEITWPNIYAGLARAPSSITAARAFAAHFRSSN